MRARLSLFFAGVPWRAEWGLQPEYLLFDALLREYPGLSWYDIYTMPRALLFGLLRCMEARYA